MLMDVTGILLTSQEDFPSSQEESDAPVISTVDPEHISEDCETSEMDVDSHIHQKEENHEEKECDHIQDETTECSEEPPRDTDKTFQLVASIPYKPRMMQGLLRGVNLGIYLQI